MKILFIGAQNETNQYINDYMSDLILHGFRSLYGDDVIDYPGSWHIYNNQDEKIDSNKDKIWGKGFTTSNLLKNYDKIDRSDILNKIKKKYFDLVVYSSIRKNETFLDDVLKFKNKFLFIDGEDDIFLSKKHYEKGLYFKRELREKQEGILPINFSIPKEKIVKDINKKPLNLLSPLIPGKLNTYIYENENEYYEMYKNSIFALTYKKAGWDCLRHYEILMNGCIPLFLNLENCPDQTMVNFPKEKLINLRKKYDSVLKYFNPLKIFKKKFLNLNNITNIFTYKMLKNNVDDYLIKNQEILELKEELLNYTKLNLTTEHSVRYILSKLS